MHADVRAPSREHVHAPTLVPTPTPTLTPTPMPAATSTPRPTPTPTPALACPHASASDSSSLARARPCKGKHARSKRVPHTHSHDEHPHAHANTRMLARTRTRCSQGARAHQRHRHPHTLLAHTRLGLRDSWRRRPRCLLSLKPPQQRSNKNVNLGGRCASFQQTTVKGGLLICSTVGNWEAPLAGRLSGCACGRWLTSRGTQFAECCCRFSGTLLRISSVLALGDSKNFQPLQTSEVAWSAWRCIGASHGVPRVGCGARALPYATNGHTSESE